MRVSIFGLVCFAIGVISASAAERTVDERSGEWQILCFGDEVSRHRDCYVIRDDLAVLVSGQGYELVIIGHGSELQPRSYMSVRVDDHPPIFWREHNLHADEAFVEAIKQFMAGNVASITWTGRQSHEDVDRRVPLVGFTKAYRRGKQIIADYEPQVVPRPHGDNAPE